MCVKLAIPVKLEGLLFDKASMDKHGQSFARFADAQIRKASLGSGVKYVDIVRDVINMVPVYWIAAVVSLCFTEDTNSSSTTLAFRPSQGSTSHTTITVGTIPRSTSKRSEISPSKSYPLRGIRT